MLLWNKKVGQKRERRRQDTTQKKYKWKVVVKLKSVLLSISLNPIMSMTRQTKLAREKKKKKTTREKICSKSNITMSRSLKKTSRVKEGVTCLERRNTRKK